MLAVLCCTALSQPEAQQSPLQALLHVQQSVTINWRDYAFNIVDTPYNRAPQQLLKTSDGLFLFIIGSGRLYQLKEGDAGIELDRIDSTFYAGYNFNAFPFVYHDSIYTLGGYGIWRINGQLRVYVPQAHSWDIVALNEEVPVLMQEEHHDLLWYNEQSAKLYTGYSITRNQAVKHSTLNEASFDYTVRFLNLKTKDWHVAGTLNEFFKDKMPLLRNIAFTPWGQLVTFGNKLLLINYSNNRLLHMREATENKIRPILFRDPDDNLHYCVDSTLYYGHTAKNTLASMPLHINDFIDTGIIVYTLPTLPAVVIIKWMAGAMALLLILVFVLKKRKQLTTVKPIVSQTNIIATAPPDVGPAVPLKEPDPTIPQPAKPYLPFDERELQILQLILSNNRQSIPTTINDVNTILGVTKKSNDTQKNQRSGVLKSINSKYGLWQNTTDKLIESKQDETDKRSRVYVIAPEKENWLVLVLADEV